MVHVVVLLGRQKIHRQPPPHEGQWQTGPETCSLCLVAAVVVGIVVVVYGVLVPRRGRGNFCMGVWYLVETEGIFVWGSGSS